MSDTDPQAQTAPVVSRIRQELGVTQAAVAAEAGLDQSRVSRIEKGEASTQADIEKVLDALGAMGSADARAFKELASKSWHAIEPPSFWNPQRASLEIAEDAVRAIDEFLADDAHPWPLRRQIERQKEALLRGAAYLHKLSHNIAFIGDIGVGKSTALSFLFDLLVPPSLTAKPMERPVLETGASGTTICEVHIKRGPEFGLSILPLPENELCELVADFCAAKWIVFTCAERDDGESVSVSREVERAIRNMTGLNRRRAMESGKPIYHDPMQELVSSCGSEEELRTRVLEMMNLSERTRRELWYDSAARQHPMEWITKTFKEVNNGRARDVSVPKSIDLLVPEFGRSFGELEITVIDTKGVDDVAVREDLDLRLKDARTAVVFCSRFNDAPGTCSRNLLEHMRQTFSEPVNTGKVAILALPRAGEARAMKDDSGETAMNDAEGYALKAFQIENELTADELGGVPTLFYNVESDDRASICEELFRQLHRMRTGVEARIFDLCSATDDLIKNSEAQAANAAMEEVANRLKHFLETHSKLATRERLAYAEALNTVRVDCNASTLWAATRRNGEYTGLNIVHHVGVGAARDARARSERWFASLKDYLAVMKKDEGLTLAARTVEQIGRSAIQSRTAFLEAVQRAGMEVYREPVANARVWIDCANQWGRGPGFKLRVADKVEEWFEQQTEPKDTLEEITNTLWDQLVLAPLRRLVEESAPEVEFGNVVPFQRRA